LLASQLPENPTDAHLVIEAVAELLDTFMATAPEETADRNKNVLPFAAS
jgi:hypothetical protein